MHEEIGVIGTTGPEMRRFFFTVDEAVKLVITALNNIDEVQGKVLSRSMKAAKIEDVLNLWVKIKGGRWEKITGRPGERDDEFLVGELELPYTCVKQFADIKHYLISFNQKVEKSLENCVSSANAVRLSEAEILEILNNPPLDER
jgi:FlaA1/EpsC-like NDP-sugar epimerase